MLQVYVKEKRKSEFAVSIPLTSKQLAQPLSGWEERTASQSGERPPCSGSMAGACWERSKRPWSRALGVGRAPLSQNFILYRSLESFYLKPNFFYWQRPWAFSAQAAIPRGQSPSRLTTPGGVGLLLQPVSPGTLLCTLTHT